MLPFSKRPVREPEPELLDSDALEPLLEPEPLVLSRSARSLASPPVQRVPLMRPEAPTRPEGQRRLDEEESTLVMSQRPQAVPPVRITPPTPTLAFSLPPPRTPPVRSPVEGVARTRSAPPPLPGPVETRASTPAPQPSPRAEARRRDEQTRLRPMADILAEGAPPRPAPASPMLHTPYAPLHPTASAAPAAPPSVAPVALDPPASVVTARTHVVRVRPHVSWAVALVAVGAIFGLSAAVIARGDADSLIDAAAGALDPGHGSSAARAGATAQSVPATVFVEAPRRLVADPPPPPVPVVEATDLKPAEAPIASAEAPKAPAKVEKAEAPRPPPVAWARPVAPKPAPVAAPVKPAPVVAAVKPPPAPRPPARPAPPSRGGSSELDSASAADALAKAQLEASLR